LGKRRKGRELLVQALYASAMSEGDLMDCLDDQLERRQASAETAAFVRPLAGRIEANAKQLDADLDALLENWNPERVGNVERAIFRLALAELRYSPDVPRNVVINEACEVARLFCDENAVRFVNGLLDKAAARIVDDPGPDPS
jgi:N utilization substance protein B